jgi:O-palmitoleoyl-L-serine hydrolase
MLDELLKVVEGNMQWGWFIDSCFVHGQTLYDITWASPVSPRLGNKVMCS